ncbi:DUF5694 domain-containing protein [Hymenobacter tibetensis]|uniref:DUF5694 domain-containing protein n=1 Tax=Hymenobacter tibetensis TaxID=497967 RepID=A0ABY4CYB2_9BACT|nr:DUF5694 domain-containing protein [Hymenobacter tibetensis]UOG75258.1 DUF5694 domain-containing protein [Hymenobacter tibetensis]
MKKAFLLLFGLCSVVQSIAQSKPTDLLLVGTFHFHNPGGDVAKVKTFDVMTPKVQAELENITNNLAAFRPDKIFVEWDYSDQRGLDELYTQYLGGKYEEYIQATYPTPGKRDFYLKNEIVQLAFRAGKKAKLTRIHAFDYNKISLPFDSVMQAIAVAKQEPLLKSLNDARASIETSQNKKIETYTLTQLLLDANTKENLTFNKGIYLDKFNRAGTASNFSGPRMVSEWYRRNLYMYSLLQKMVEPQDDKVMVLVGSGHAAIIQDFVTYDSTFKLTELKNVLKK